MYQKSFVGRALSGPLADPGSEFGATLWARSANLYNKGLGPPDLCYIGSRSGRGEVQRQSLWSGVNGWRHWRALKLNAFCHHHHLRSSRPICPKIFNFIGRRTTGSPGIPPVARTGYGSSQHSQTPQLDLGRGCPGQGGTQNKGSEKGGKVNRGEGKCGKEGRDMSTTVPYLQFFFPLPVLRVYTYSLNIFISYSNYKFMELLWLPFSPVYQFFLRIFSHCALFLNRRLWL